MKATLGGLALLVCSQAAMAEMYRCHLPDGAIVFRQEPCPLTELNAPEAPPAPIPAVRAPLVEHAVTLGLPAAAPPPKAPALQRPVSVPRVTAVAPAALASSQDEPFTRPTKRKREVVELTAQFERCRADAPGFAEQSETTYIAWRQRHAPVLAEYDKLVAAKVRAGRRGEATLPLRHCTEDWLRGLEPLTRAPDPRFATVEKTWQVFMGALMTGDRATALSCLGGRAETRWKLRTDGLGDDELRRIGASIRALKVQWGDDYEKEGIVADTENRAVAIGFRNVNEEWKITEFGGGPPKALPAD